MPLFSLRGERDWGIGEIGHLPTFARWLAAGGHHVIQLLPLLEMSPGERSPYTALSAFAIDPIYLSLGEVEDFAAAGGEAAMPAPARAALDAARGTSAIDYDAVRKAKRAALEVAFARFLETEWRGGSVRAAAFARFRAVESDWLEEYALFRVCQEQHALHAWTGWEPALRDRAPAALERARRTLESERLFHEYVQWLATEQWAAARHAAARVGVRLQGDLPFMVSPNSADVWSRQEEFSAEATLGAPPDAFNAEGQQWGLPAYRWDIMGRGGRAWLRARVGRARALFDAFRVDHVVGFYRQYVFPADSAPAFAPAEELDQLALGEQLLGVILEAAAPAGVIGEDLGVVPAFVRSSLARLGIPGYRVLRWEAQDGVFDDPRTYPALSVATSGTHDTSGLATWWEEELDADGRRALAAVPSFGALADGPPEFTPAVHAALLDGLYAAGSDLVVIPFPDAYGGRERINVPATVGSDNWAYRLPWTVAELLGPAGSALRDRLQALAARHGRTGGD